jgi:class 3 adenylate cyclase
MISAPETKYTTGRGGEIAYQVVGDGPVDIVLVSHEGVVLEVMWEQPLIVRTLERFGAFSRLVLFDHRGTGVSDPLPTDHRLTLEDRIADMRAVMDAVGSERAALVASSDGGPMSILYAATHPERTSALILYGSFARMAWAPDYPCGLPASLYDMWAELLRTRYGDGSTLAAVAPSLAADDGWRRWWARGERLGYSRAAVLALFETAWEIDTVDILPTVQVPTLVIHRTSDRWIAVGHGRFLAEHIPGARFVELPGDDHLFYAGDSDAVLDEIEEFLTGTRHGGESHRVLTTLLFTDIVGSTEVAAQVGDRAWYDLLERHHAAVRRELVRFDGVEVDTAGDGFLATFDGPGRAVRCALTIVDAVAAMGLTIRAGLHTGECELVGGKVAGMAVHIGARVAGAAGPGEVVVSSTVKDLLAGSGLTFSDRGVRPLKGIPDEWRLFGAHASRPAT